MSPTDLWMLAALLCTLALVVLFAAWPALIAAHRAGTKTARHPAQHVGDPWWRDTTLHHHAAVIGGSTVGVLGLLITAGMVARAVTA